MCFMEKETWNVILKFGDIFPWRDSAQGQRNEIWWKAVFCQIYVRFFEKKRYVVIETYFSLFLKGFGDIS